MQVESEPSDNLYFADLPAGFDEAAIQHIFAAYGTITQKKLLPVPVPGSKVSALIRFGTLDEAKWIVENLNGNIPQGLTDPIIVKYATKPPGKGLGKGGVPAMAANFRATPYGGAPAFPANGMFGGAMPGMQMQMQAMPAAAKGAGKGMMGKVSMKVVCQGLLAANALPGAGSPEEHTLYVAGLPADTQDIDLYKIFSPFGAIAPKAGVRAMMHADSGNCKGFGFVNFLDPNSAQIATDTLNGTALPDGTTLQVKPKDPKGAVAGMAGMAGMGGMAGMAGMMMGMNGM